jgi:hypothetical protein
MCPVVNQCFGVSSRGQIHQNIVYNLEGIQNLLSDAP